MASLPDDLSARLETLLRALAREAPGPEDAPPPLPGDLLGGRYEILGELGRGGFGVVYAALDTTLLRQVAVKVLRHRALRALAEREPLREEALAAARLDHPAVVTVHDLGPWRGGLYLVLERLHGETLAERLRRGPLPREDALRVGRRVASALAAAHAAGVVHRDLKPGNVFLTTDGRVKVLDFGLSTSPDHRAGLAGGTPGYASPEQARGEPEDARTDVYAFGVLLHEALSARPGGAAATVASATLPDPGRARAPRAAGVPAPLARLLERCRAEDPAGRPADGRALEAALDGAIREWEASRRRLHGGVAAAAAVALGALGWLAWPRPGAPPPVVLVADAVNETGDARLDGAGRLLETALARFHIQVVRRERVVRLAARAGHGAGGRLDVGAACAVASEAGAALVLVPQLHPDGDGVALAVSAVDPASERAVRAIEPVRRQGEAPLFALVEDASERVRTVLRAAAGAEPARPIEELVTRDAEAYRLYDEGVRCLERQVGGTGEPCAPALQAALARDPGFGLAHYQLARAAEMSHDAAAQQEGVLAPALRHLERLPSRERELVLAWRERLDGKVAAARARYAALLEQAPDDAEVAWTFGELEWHAGDVAASVPLLETVLRLDPRHPWALDHLVRALGYLGQLGRLRELAQGLEAAVGAGERHALVRALGWLGEHDRAIAAARQAEAQGAPTGAADVLAALVAGGRLEEAEAILRPQVGWRARSRLAAILLQEGRVREARAELEGLTLADGESPLVVRFRRLSLLAGLGDAAGVRRELEALAREGPEEVPWVSIPLAWAGDLAGAAELAARLPAGSTAAAIHAAVAALRSGDAAGAVRLLRAGPEGAFAADVPVDGRAFLLAVALARADAPEALEALRHYQAFYAPDSYWRPWALPQSRLEAAGWLARQGRAAEARVELDGLLAALSRADPDLELLRSAREARAALESR
ncbi:MAG: serine/threonine-protein kinase [Anaeromyxobacteraceae bacterium]